MRSILQTALLACLFAVLAYFSMDFRSPDSISTLIWPAGGVMLGVLMLTERRRWPFWLALTFSIHAICGVMAGRPMTVALIFPLSQLIVMPLIASLWLNRARAPLTLDSLYNLLWFIGLLCAGSLFGGAIISMALAAANVALPSGNWIAPVISDTVGSLIGVPLIMAWLTWSARRSGGLNTAEFKIGAVWFLLLIGSAYIVFDGTTAQAILGSTRYELSYLPLLFLGLVAMQWDRKGVTFALLILAVIATTNTLQGEGPFTTKNESLSVALLELQVYLGTTALLGLVMSAIASSRNSALLAAAALKLRFEAALACSQHLVYEFDPATKRIDWGGDTLTLLGVAPDALQTIEQFMQRVHVDDEGALRDAVARKLQNRNNASNQTQTLHFRFRCGDGIYRSIVDTGAPLSDLEDDVFRLSGLLQVQSTPDTPPNAC